MPRKLSSKPKKSPKAKAKKSAKQDAAKKPIGEVTHYYSHLEVGIIKLKSPLKSGERIKIHGHTTDFEQTVDSMQIEHKTVDKAKKGDVIGMKVADKVREGDLVYKADED